MRAAQREQAALQPAGGFGDAQKGARVKVFRTDDLRWRTGTISDCLGCACHPCPLAWGGCALGRGAVGRCCKCFP